MKTIPELYTFLNGYMSGVVSTVTPDGQPQAAIVGFGQTKDLAIIFGTANTTRKYQNLQSNPKVSFTIGGATLETIQLQGTARELKPDEVDLVRDTYWIKAPFAEAQSHNLNQRYFIIEPEWLRYTNIKPKPWAITEISF